jgi:hypothetical protein
MEYGPARKWMIRSDEIRHANALWKHQKICKTVRQQGELTVDLPKESGGFVKTSVLSVLFSILVAILVVAYIDSNGETIGGWAAYLIRGFTFDS